MFGEGCRPDAKCYVSKDPRRAFDGFDFKTTENVDEIYLFSGDDSVSLAGQLACSLSVLVANATLPADLNYVVPEGAQSGQTVFLEGPHGPFKITLPEGAKPGQPAIFRLGPASLWRIEVPDGKDPGDKITVCCLGESDIEVIIPEGKTAGDSFEFCPPVMMVQVPEGAREGSLVTFRSPAGRKHTVPVPAGVPVGQYFASPLTRVDFTGGEDVASDRVDRTD